MDVGADGSPSHGVVDGLEFSPFGPVPDLEGLAESGGDANESLCFGEDGVGANEVLAGSSLDLDVEWHLDSGSTGPGCQVPDLDVEFPMAACENGCLRECFDGIDSTMGALSVLTLEASEWDDLKVCGAFLGMDGLGSWAEKGSLV